MKPRTTQCAKQIHAQKSPFSAPNMFYGSVDVLFPNRMVTRNKDRRQEKTNGCGNGAIEESRNPMDAFISLGRLEVNDDIILSDS